MLLLIDCVTINRIHVTINRIHIAIDRLLLKNTCYY